jgi:ribosomal protein L29
MRIKEVRHDIARIMTVLTERELVAAGESHEGEEEAS